MTQSQQTVLIVDDFFQDRQMYRRYLTNDPGITYTILEAESAFDGLKVCELQQIDGILLDFRLPDLDGLQFLAKLKAQGGKTFPPIVMMIEQEDESIADQAMKSGAEDYLVKSQITPNRLRLTLQTAIEHTALRRALQQTQQALRDSEERYQAIVQDQAVLICHFLPDGTLTFVNPAYCRYFGTTAETLLGQNFLHLIPEGAREQIQQQIDVLNTLTPDRPTLIQEHLVCRSNGEIGWQQWTNRAIFNSADQIIEFQAAGRDISEQKATELSLQQATERFELAVMATNGLIYDWNFKNNTVYRSRGLMDLCGYCPEEVDPSLQWWWQQIHPEDLARFDFSNLNEHLESLDRYCVEYRVRHRNGHYLWVEDRGLVVKDITGQPIRIVGSTIDISNRKQTEADLRESEARLKRLVDLNLIGIEFWDADGTVLDANDAFLNLVGYTREDLHDGKVNWRALTPPEQIQLSDASIEKMRQQTSDTLEKEYIRKDGSRISVLLGGVMFEGSHHRGISFVVDLTEQKQLQREREMLLAEAQNARAAAELANRTKDEFLAIVSHELRSPLNAILGWTKLLRSRQFDSARVEQALETIERNTQAQVKLIEDLLDVSRILRGQLRLDCVPIHLAPIITVVVANGQLAATAKQIRLCSTIEPEVGRILGDANRLQQILTNIVTNAIKFTPNGGHVTVSLEQVGNDAAVSVTDTGQGISADFLPYIFERFRQVENSTTRSKDGLGLGLAIVRHLVELHGGTVQVESPGLNQGATFTVRFPLIDQVAQPTSIEPNPTIADLSKVKILIVDDVLDTCDYLQFVLSDFGATVAIAHSAAQAYGIFQQFVPDVLLSDIGMPEEDGYSLLQRIRQLPQGQSVKAIALTAFAKPEDCDRALGSGFQAHLAKPVEPDDLINAIVKVFNHA
ncbi:PAS domain S-box protein [Leptolyngbya sp. GGD]|uniref:PAS domain S-box protein n=1 Tax=Leptolyngbya sp. GGD TaxID=2997907 RepID=UPI00227A38B8|nr:PAS domain S-box protein [Leptolyngbya sp. GGD]MCY6490202.1 PAS domain S-box protein [Leptolyngbya sp. GGD]